MTTLVWKRLFFTALALSVVFLTGWTFRLPIGWDDEYANRTFFADTTTIEDGDSLVITSSGKHLHTVTIHGQCWDAANDILATVRISVDGTNYFTYRRVQPTYDAAGNPMDVILFQSDLPRDTDSVVVLNSAGTDDSTWVAYYGFYQDD